MFESDCWLDWDPDPDRASRAADPTLEPYASMSKQQVLELMLCAKGGEEWEFLQEHFLNKCTTEELAVGPEEFMETQYGVFGFEELCYLEGAIVMALDRRRGSAGPGRGQHAGSRDGPYAFSLQSRFGSPHSFPIPDRPAPLRPSGPGAV